MSTFICWLNNNLPIPRYYALVQAKLVGDFIMVDKNMKDVKTLLKASAGEKVVLDEYQKLRAAGNEAVVRTLSKAGKDSTPKL
jgi:hypothetical protein